MNWTKVKEYEDIIYEKSDGIAKVTINDRISEMLFDL